jgi:hypothetical protein
MKLSTILPLLFILPGFFSFLIIQVNKIGFAKESTQFEKTLYSLLFNFPIFVITIFILNTNMLIKIISKINEKYSGFDTLHQFEIIFFENIDMIIVLSLVVTLISILVAIGWLIIFKIYTIIHNTLTKNKITHYKTIWKSMFVNVRSEIPVSIYKLDGADPIAEGFITEVSTTLADNLEFELSGIEIFTACKEQNLLDEIKNIYINTDKGIKIIIYDDSKINELLGLNAERRDSKWKRIKNRMILLLLNIKILK